MKQAASDQRDYIKSKAKLLGTIKSMTSKELEDKIATRFIQLQSELDDKLARTIKAAYTLSNVIDHQCPLKTWQALVTLLTTRQSGNKRLDLNAAMNAFASLRQRNNETLLDYLQRFKGSLEYFNLADPTYTVAQTPWAPTTACWTQLQTALWSETRPSLTTYTDAKPSTSTV